MDQFVDVCVYFSSPTFLSRKIWPHHLPHLPNICQCVLLVRCADETWCNWVEGAGKAKQQPVFGVCPSVFSTLKSSSFTAFVWGQKYNSPGWEGHSFQPERKNNFRGAETLQTHLLHFTGVYLYITVTVIVLLFISPSLLGWDWWFDIKPPTSCWLPSCSAQVNHFEVGVDSNGCGPRTHYHFPPHLCGKKVSSIFCFKPPLFIQRHLELHTLSGH